MEKGDREARLGRLSESQHREGTGVMEDKGDRGLDSSYSLGSVKAGIELTGTEAVILHLEIGAAKGQGGS